MDGFLFLFGWILRIQSEFTRINLITKRYQFYLVKLKEQNKKNKIKRTKRKEQNEKNKMKRTLLNTCLRH